MSVLQLTVLLILLGQHCPVPELQVHFTLPLPFTNSVLKEPFSLILKKNPSGSLKSIPLSD